MRRHNNKLFSLAAIAALLSSPFALAQDEVDASAHGTINVEAQPLAAALKDFSDQTGLQLAYVATLAENKTSNGVEAAISPNDALDAILDSTGLEYQFVNDETVAISVADERGDSDSKNLTPQPVLMAENQTSPAQMASSRSEEGDTSIVTGKVIDARTGANLKGARVTIEETGQWTSTDDLGEFRFGSVPAGSATITVSFLGYTEQSVAIGVRGPSVSQNFALRDGSEVDEIVVFGTRSARALSLNQERTADNFSTVLSSDLLGQFEGTTVSEALRRAPGVAFVQDPESGDGTNVIVRGLSPDFNTVTVNGLRLPENTGTGRAADLSNILADSISKITINKTLLASQDSSGTGALVDIETKRPFDRPQRYFSLGYEAGRTSDDLFLDDRLLSATASGLFGRNDRLGVSVSVQYRERDITRLSYNTFFRYGEYFPIVDGAPINGSGSLDPREFSFPFEPGVDSAIIAGVQSTYGNVSTTNLSSTISLDWKLSETTGFQLDVSRYDNQTDSLNRTMVAQPVVLTTRLLPIEELGGEERYALTWEDAGTGFGFPGVLFSVSQSLADDRDQENVTDLFSLRGTSRHKKFSLDYAIGHSKGETRRPFDAFLSLGQPFGSLVSTLDESLFAPEMRSQENTVDGLIISPWAPRRGNNDFPLPLFSEAGFAHFNDPSVYFLRGASIIHAEGRNERTTGRIDATYEMEIGSVRYLQFGTFYESAEFRNDIFGTADLTTVNEPTLADVGLVLTEDNLEPIGRSGGFNVISESDIQSFFNQLDEIVAGNPDLSLNLRNQNGNDNPLFANRMTTEEETAAYVQARIDIGRLELLPGLRYMRTEIDARTPQFPTLTDEDGVFDTEFRDTNTALVDIKATQDEVLPRVLFNYRFTDNLILRGGYFNTVARPQIELMNSNNQLRLDLRPRFGPNGDQPFLTIETGNPDLKPADTDNYDLSVEYYDGDIGAAKLSFFYKETENLLETNTVQSTTDLEGVELPDDPRFQNLPENLFVTRRTSRNSPHNARLWGVEVAFEKQLTFLPGIWDGLGTYINYTYSESSKVEQRGFFDSAAGELVKYDVRTRYQGQPDDSGTIAVTYNKYNLDASLAFTKQAKRQIRTGQFDVNPFFAEDESLDFKARYQFDAVGSTWNVYLEASDLLKDSSDPDVEQFEGGERSLPRFYTDASFFGGRIYRVGVVGTFGNR